MGSWSIAEDYIFTIMEDLNGNSSAFIDWNMVLDSHGGPSWVGKYAHSAIHTDADDNDVFYKNPIFYAIGHFSRFIEPGWKLRFCRKDFGGPSASDVSFVVAEGGDEDRVAVIQNRSNDPIDVNYFDQDTKKELKFTLNANSITTLYYTYQ